LILSLKHRKKSYKLIHVHNPPELLVFAAFIPKLFGAKIILDMHENVPEFYESKFHKGSSDTPLTKSLLFIERISTNYADHVIAAHDLLKERIIRRDGIPEENCMALLNYPNVVGSPESTSNNLEFRIIYPGTISYRHGVDILIRALALVKNQLPGVRLDFYSNQRKDKYWHFLNRLIDDLGVRDNVLFYNPIKSEELGKILRNATFGIVPKRAGNFESEAFSSKILDFMTAGIPIIASRTKIDEFYFDDSMIMFFEPENHQDLGKCMLDLYKNPEKGKWLVNNANEFIKTNNWGIKKKTYFNLVNRLIK
jgi:glycosyltransferase involved in cell wall biosynthesis